MNKLLTKRKYSIFFFILLFFFIFHTAFAETPSPTNTSTPTPTVDSQAVKDLQNKIQDLQNKVTDLQGQEKTLSSQITVMDNQITLTEYKIQSTQKQITDLTLDIDTASKKVDSIQKSLADLTKVLLNRIVATYEVGSAQQFQALVASSSVSDLIQRANYLRIAQAHDKKLIYDTMQAKNDYANQKSIYEEKKRKILALKTDLESYSKQLDTEKQNKQTLLSETQGSEANYQSLLSQAKAQLAGFSQFAVSQGGASILSGQTVCDDWGCYYNQRDGQWGNNALNGTGYTLASDGCLITSMAMMFTHYGHKGVTPQTINGNSGNFASYYPAYLKYTISADGATASRVGASLSDLSSGPLIVGIRYANGGTHFVVMVKKDDNGDYIMNDPFTANGHMVKFTEHYSLGSIFEVDKVSM